MPNPHYRSMFPDLEPFYCDPNALSLLAELMTQEPKAENPGKIPAGYTYLSQFISHDISFQQDTDRFFRRDLPWEVMDPNLIQQIVNLRTPNLNLETVYGREVPVNRGEPSRISLMRDPDPYGKRLPLLALGDTIGADSGTAGISYPCDLPRGRVSVKAKIVDQRNDENLLLAQTQVAFIKFHNAVVMTLSNCYMTGNGHFAKELFEAARKIVIRHYQSMILSDFLPKIVCSQIIDDVKRGVVPEVPNQKIQYEPDLFVPLEFAAAAFRFGHSMTRREYVLNSKFAGTGKPGVEDPAALMRMFQFTGTGEMTDGGSDPALALRSLWIISWYDFYDFGHKRPLNYAEKIDTQLAFGLSQLRPIDPGIGGGPSSSLIALDLYRGRRLGLPAGQDIAERLGFKPLNPSEIERVISSKKGDETTKAAVLKEFGKKTPLFFYVLAEAEVQADGKLGSVGSWIVAETLIRIMYQSDYSILRTPFTDCESLTGKTSFGIVDMFCFIRSMGNKYLETLYPNGPAEVFDELDPIG